MGVHRVYVQRFVAINFIFGAPFLVQVDRKGVLHVTVLTLVLAVVVLSGGAVAALTTGSFGAAAIGGVAGAI